MLKYPDSYYWHFAYPGWNIEYFRYGGSHYTLLHCQIAEFVYDTGLCYLNRSIMDKKIKCMIKDIAELQ